MQLNFENPPKVYEVINPVAGTTQAGDVRGTIGSVLVEQNLSFEIYETTGEEGLGDIVRDAIRDGFGLFLAVGWDGTIAGVASWLVGTQVPLVIVPAGTWNAPARVLERPIQVRPALGLMFREH